jgi:hypothetical protein
MDGLNRRNRNWHSKLEVRALLGQPWQDLDALLRLMEIELEEAKWQRLGSDLEMVEA